MSKLLLLRTLIIVILEIQILLNNINTNYATNSVVVASPREDAPPTQRAAAQPASGQPNNNNNNATCDPCSMELLQSLEDIRQDIIYANKYIDRGRVNSRISQKLVDLSNALDEHESALADSMQLLDNKSRQLRSDLGLRLPTTNNDVFEPIYKAIDTKLIKMERDSAELEREALSYSQRIRKTDESKRKIEANVDNLLVKLQDILTELSTTMYDFEQMNKNNITNDAADSDVKQLELNATKLIAEQVGIGKRLGEDLAEIEDYKAKIDKQKTSLSNSTDLSWLFDEDRLGALEKAEEYFQAKLLRTKEIIFHMDKLKQLVAGNMTLEGQNRLEIWSLNEKVRQGERKYLRLSKKFDLAQNLEKKLTRLVSSGNQLVNGNLLQQLSSLSAKTNKLLEMSQIEAAIIEESINKTLNNYSEATLNINKYVSLLRAPMEVINLENRLTAINSKLADIKAELDQQRGRKSLKEASLMFLNATKNESDLYVNNLKRDNSLMKRIIFNSALELEQNFALCNLIQQDVVTYWADLSNLDVRQNARALNRTANNLEELAHRLQASEFKYNDAARDFQLAFATLNDKLDKKILVDLRQFQLANNNLNQLSVRLKEVSKISSNISKTDDIIKQSIESLKSKTNKARELLNIKLIREKKSE